MKLKEKLQSQQVKLLEELQSKGYNIVSCCDCNSIIIVRVDQDEIQCPDCLVKADSSAFSDLTY